MSPGCFLLSFCVTKRFLTDIVSPSICVLFQLCTPYKNSHICNMTWVFYSLCWLIRAITRLIISECFFTAFFSGVNNSCLCRRNSLIVWLYMTRRGNSGLNNVCYLYLCNFIVFFTAVVCESGCVSVHARFSQIIK